jgi:hypothetical protein
MSETHTQQQDHRHSPWTKGRLVGQKRPLKPKEVRADRLLPGMKRSVAPCDSEIRQTRKVTPASRMSRSSFGGGLALFRKTRL